MRRPTISFIYCLLLSVGLGLGIQASIAEAQERFLPELSSPVGEDPLMALLRPSTCPTGRNAGRPADGGYKFTVTGSCSETDMQANLFVPVPELGLPDGQVRVELLVPHGWEQARFVLWFRVQPNGDGYYATIDPAQGAAALVLRTGERNSVLAERTGLLNLVVQNDWNSLAVRVQGPILWLLLNDRPVLSASDVSFDSGAVALGVRRLGSLSSEIETAAVVRNLAVFGTASGDETRLPVYLGPPGIGETILEDSLNRAGVLREGACASNEVSGAFVEEGYLVKLVGRCSAALPRAELVQQIQGLTFADGEVGLEERVLTGADRSETVIAMRVQALGGYYAAFNAALGRVRLFKVVDQQATVLGERTDLATVLSPDGSNNLAVRAEGPKLWLLVNGLPVLSAVDSTHDSGSVLLMHSKLGPADDLQESATVMRSLRVSGLVSGDRARLPTYEPRP